MTIIIATNLPDETKLLAQNLARGLQGSEVIELVSDLGGGKTTFVQGLAAGLGYKQAVTSPTFTISQIYPLPNGWELHHYDLYRLVQAGVVGQEIGEDMGQPGIITVIEWGEVVEELLPVDRLTVQATVMGELKREWAFHASGPLSSHLLTQVQP